MVHMDSRHSNFRATNLDSNLEVDLDPQDWEILSSYSQMCKARIIHQSQIKYYQEIKITTTIISDLR